jgi:hypothetical protein
MDDSPARRFVLQPNADCQHLDEALRAVGIEGCHPKDAAERFGYDYAAFRSTGHTLPRPRCRATIRFCVRRRWTGWLC